MLDRTTFVVYYVNMDSKKQKTKEAWISVKIDTPLKTKIKKIARDERRTISDQAIFLMEMGLRVLERAK